VSTKSGQFQSAFAQNRGERLRDDVSGKAGAERFADGQTNPGEGALLARCEFARGLDLAFAWHAPPF